MDCEFKSVKLEDVFFDHDSTLGHGSAVDKAYRKVLGKILAAIDERDLRAMKSLRYHKLKGKRNYQHSIKLTHQWRLIVERIDRNGRTGLLIISVEDYH